MNRIQCIGRLAAVLPGLGGIPLASTAAALTRVPPPGGRNNHPPMPLGHVVGPVVRVPGHAVGGGMPVWQIALIAAGALLAAVLAVVVDLRHVIADRYAIGTSRRVGRST